MYRYPLILLVLLLAGCSAYHGAFSTRKYTGGIFDNRPGESQRVESCPLNQAGTKVCKVYKVKNGNAVDRGFQVFAAKEYKAQNTVVAESCLPSKKIQFRNNAVSFEIIPGHNDRKKGTSDYSGPTPKPKHTLKKILIVFLGVVVLGLFILSLWATLGFLGLLIFLALCTLIFAIIILADKHKEADTTLAGDTTNLGQLGFFMVLPGIIGTSLLLLFLAPPYGALIIALLVFGFLMLAGGMALCAYASFHHDNHPGDALMGLFFALAFGFFLILSQVIR